ncbi:MAG: RIP metalloprotease RseP [Desulfovibrio sp.]|nr:MAG: RIP metalloprotease RseP [Desulfovibrio sp.]
MQTTIAIIFVLGALIFFHELGHFLAARFLKIGVRTFSLGFGPKLLGLTRGQTTYKLAVLPLGGYVQLVGERKEEDLPEGFTKSQSFALRPAWQRMIVVVAGPLFNFLLAWVIFWGIFVFGGMDLPRIDEVSDDSPALEAGLQAGDVITAIDGSQVVDWRELQYAILLSNGEEIVLTVERGQENVDLLVTPEATPIPDTDESIFLIGVGLSPENQDVGLIEGAWYGGVRIWHELKNIGKGFAKLFSGEIPVKKALGGPILIGQMVSHGADQGMGPLLFLTAFISINLGLLNLLPIPVLDGGHLLFFFLETVFRRPVNQRVQEVTTQVGLVLLLGLMVFATYNDIDRNWQNISEWFSGLF